MTYQPAIHPDDLINVPKLPAWVTSARAKTLEDVAFLSGAALNHLHLVLAHDATPQTLLRAHLALRAAEACLTHQGRPERAGDLRDAAAFLQPGDSAGPAGEVYLSWRRATLRPISVKALHRALPELEAEQIAIWLDAGQGAPVMRASAVLQAVLEERPRDIVAALVLADAALAQALGWEFILPLLALGLKRGDLRKTGAELRSSCHRAVVVCAAETTRQASVLSRGTARLLAVAPKLRAKGADEALQHFLTEEAVAPTSLISLGSKRASRRFCDRLVELGVVRELTGRDTFRLYGV
ncbi:uncharacterized protein DUF1403 [Litoreibacter halocynthiae]|uniref:Uncharacterized protein DUF1403 n=1 Tax=Litoreibacter halocynthiae TaxID=1242689 RepID=A0A4R7LC33_9RHOB|nr:DUF1403 family protein [Litoreibacter halocynthiae]TDT72674.1 uncharacterized protein DUF1403 [Litoreibacter halocynthiae]